MQIMNLHKCILLNCLVLLGLTDGANAAGTYYTGASYQPAQYRYGQSGSYVNSGAYNRTASVGTPSYVSSARYNNYSQPNTQQNSRATTNANQTISSKKGFFANAGISHEFGMWKIDMVNTANSVLKYNDLEWNVFDLNAGYVFDLGRTKMQFDAGFKYGMQWGESSMTDDDISNGGYGVTEYKKSNGDVIGTIIGHGLSIGTSQDGSMLGFNIGLGLTDVWKWGNMKITPSIGYRYFKHKLETKNNYGMLMDTVLGGCDSSGGESICGTTLMFYSTANGVSPDAILAANGRVQIPGGELYVDTSDTYYFEQPGTSHSYETEWSGPYIALDMLYDINQNNSINGRIELGFPGYTSTGDQPYRWDWAHPKSVEDSANMFSAFHLGLAANWKTAITKSVALSLGMTYDYYTISGADTETYLNKKYYNQLANLDSRTEQEQLKMNYLDALRQDCGGWVCKASKEIDSVYKSMGVRAGIDVRF